MTPLLQSIKTRISANRILNLMSQARKLSDRKEYERAHKLDREAAELGCVRAVCIGSPKLPMPGKNRPRRI